MTGVIRTDAKVWAKSRVVFIDTASGDVFAAYALDSADPVGFDHLTDGDAVTFTPILYKRLRGCAAAGDVQRVHP